VVWRRFCSCVVLPDHAGPISNYLIHNNLTIKFECAMRFGILCDGVYGMRLTGHRRNCPPGRARTPSGAATGGHPGDTKRPSAPPGRRHGDAKLKNKDAAEGQHGGKVSTEKDRSGVARSRRLYSHPQGVVPYTSRCAGMRSLHRPLPANLRFMTPGFGN